MSLKTVAKGIAAVAAAGIALSAAPHCSRETLEVNVKAVEGNRVFTDRGEFENTWSVWEWKLSPCKIEEGKTYLIGVYGWDFLWPFDWERNIMYAKEMPQDGF